MPYCVNCGVELSPGVTHCPLCGTPVYHPDALRKDAEASFFAAKKEEIPPVSHRELALLLLIGFAYLLIRKVISARIPVTYILTVAVLTFLFPRGNDRIAWMAAQVFGGGLMLGAIFMATDYVTSPVTHLGQIVYAIGCGVLTVMIRYFGGYNEGVSYAILCMNACTVLLDKVGHPVKFGAPKKEAAKK